MQGSSSSCWPCTLIKYFLAPKIKNLVIVVLLIFKLNSMNLIQVLYIFAFNSLLYLIYFTWLSLLYFTWCIAYFTSLYLEQLTLLYLVYSQLYFTLLGVANFTLLGQAYFALIYLLKPALLDFVYLILHYFTWCS